MVTKGNLTHCAAMAEIFNHYVAASTVIFSNRQLTAKDMRQKLQQVVDRFPFYVWVDDETGRVDGYCYAHLWMPDEVYCHTWEITIYIRNDAVGKGIGRKLFNATIDACRADVTCHSLVSFITAGNTPCERLHRSLGFELRGVLPGVGYKFGLWLDDAIYQLTLK